MVSRRAFLASAGAALAAPSDRVRVGFIGVGGQGAGRLRGFLNHPDVAVAAVCDVDENHAARAAALAAERRGTKPPVFRDFRRLLELRDLDAVMIATPDHWHALPTVMACQAGKDVFVEKPLCHSMNEGRAMAAAARRYNRVTQLGNHIHNDLPNYRRVVELIRSGILGDVRRAYCWIRSAREGLGNPPDAPAPAGLDYDLWLGPAPRRPYNPNRAHRSFRYFWDYSGGVFIDFWCHITDVLYWALDLTAPKSVSAAGGRFLDDNAETPNVMEAVYEYPGLLLSWNVHPHAQPGFEDEGIGCVLQGSKATLFVNYQQHRLYVEGRQVTDFKRPEPSIPDSPGHIREFLDAVKSRRPTTCNLDYAWRLTKGGLLGNIAYRTGRRIYWDETRETITGDNRARDLMTRRYRKPWKL
ncbi:MAG: Gfo/Idh/MocA family protein [Bryobacteraceae bacterium]